MRLLAATALAAWTQLDGATPTFGGHAVVTFRGVGGSVGRRDRATHLLHWYPAKMFYRIPDQILQTLRPDNCSVILDPFCGSGTVLVEGFMRGYSTIGIDINPLAQLISRVKTTPLLRTELATTAQRILKLARSYRTKPGDEQLPPYWFLEQPRVALHRLRRAVESVENKSYQDFFLVCLSSIVRRCSLADPSIPPPVRMTPTRALVAGRRYKAAFEAASSLSHDDVFARFIRTVEANTSRIAELANVRHPGTSNVIDASAADTGLPSKSVDLTITSPPYCGAQKYVRSLSLELRLLGLSDTELSELDRRTLGTERPSRAKSSGLLLPAAETLVNSITAQNPRRGSMLRDYLAGLAAFSQELKRVMKVGANAFVTFGTSHIAGVEVNLARLYAAIAEASGLSFVAMLEDEIPTRGMITKRHSTSDTIAQEYVVWLKSL